LNAPDIFLSYNREDAAIARAYADAFAREGLEVWWDATLRSGEAYDEVTEAALKNAKAVVVLWSKKSVVSRWVRAEATLADRNRTLVPAMIEPCERPIMFELTQTADLAHWSGDARDPAWRAFLTDVRRLVEAGGASQRPASPVASAPAVPPAHSRRSTIAVLPFINRSGLREDDVFADCMVEDLAAALSLSRRLNVLASSATLGYRSGARDPRQIGRDLGARYLLEGNVRRVGSDLRVTAQLVEAESSDILWTQKFDRPLAQLAALQEDLVTDVAAHLGVQVERVEMEQALKKPGNITAWEAVARADAHMSRGTQSSAEAAVAEARRAVAIAPDYDAAYATLAAALGMLRKERGSDDPELTQEILDNVARARAFNPGNPLVLCRIAAALNFIKLNVEALQLAERAVAINPNLEFPRIGLGTSLLNLGRRDEAIAAFEVAERLAPKSIWSAMSSIMRSAAHFHSGRFEPALELADQSLRLGDNPYRQILRLLCLARLDRWDEARDAMRRWRDANPARPYSFVEKLVRSELWHGPNPVHLEEDVETVRRLWNATGGDA
jgi:TolB-like protein